MFCAGLQILYFSEFDLEFFADRPQMLRHVRKVKRQVRYVLAILVFWPGLLR